MEVIERPTLAQVFRRFYRRFRQGSDVTAEQRRAAWCIQVCRTPALGGRQFDCPRCHQAHRVYHSCRNRHCPVCLGARSYAWLEAQRAHLLPVPYFHVVFTVPSELNVVFLYNRAALYDLLLRTAAGTLQSFAADPQWLGAQLGLLGVLHSCGQTLTPHAHVHFIVPQGGIDAAGRWVSPKVGTEAKFLFPIQAVSRVFRGRLLATLEKRQRELKFPDPLTESRFGDTLRIAASKRWEVYAQRPFAGPQMLLRYLSLYTHRAPISSGRLVQCDQHAVTFRYKDYRHGGREATLQLSGEVFVGRVLGQVLPAGFRRVRAYGYLANGAGREKLAGLQAGWLARLGMVLAVLGAWAPGGEAAEEDAPGPWAPECPRCGYGPLALVGVVEPVPWTDTS